MTLVVGTRLGPYEIVAPLGAGGMGEVYRARDTRLGRDVAVKVLPQHLASTPEQRARFEREAKTISSLNHPHICVLHDVGREGNTDYLVMELVEGDTLATKLAKGPLATEQVLRFGAEIADALARAHRAGIIHRDLKPGNVMLTKSGTKLMDFGLAREGTERSADFAQSPTIAQPLTAEGAIIGTFQYMAPEQLDGAEADARTDLWALGCVLYEMATGKHAFEGKSQASLIGAVMHAEPQPVSQIAPMSPPALDRLVSALLAKDPEERVQTAHDVGLQLRWIAEGGSGASGVAVAPKGAHVRRLRRREWAAWAVAVLGLLAAAATLRRARDSGKVPVIRAIVPQPPNALFLFIGDNAGPPVLSPDGNRIAFVAVDSERGARVWVREVSTLAARPLAGTENATFPFWSWDGRSLAYFADLKLKRVDVSTGQVITICDSPGGRGGTWSQNDEIVFSQDFRGGLSRVRAMGGASAPLTACDSTQHTTHRWPHFLPDGQHFLYYAGDHHDVRGRQNAVWIGSLDGRESHELMPCATEAMYADGQLLYVLDSVLMARPFDARARRFSSDAVATAERVQFDPTTWRANFSVSQVGLLAYQATGGKQGSQIQVFDREGHRLKTAGESGNHFAVALTSDAKRIVYSSQLGPNGDLFVYDVEREVTRRLTLSEEDEDMPTLSPDGRTIAYTVKRSSSTTYMIQAMSLDGGGAPRVLCQHARDVWPLDWSTDGRRLLIGIGSFSSIVADSIAVLTLDGSEPLRVFTETAGSIGFGHFSNDGRWVAYGTTGGSDPQVFIQPAPGAVSAAGFEGAGRVQVSFHGGAVPRWRADDRELYYVRPDGAIVAVPLAPVTMQPGQETSLFRAIVRPQYSSLDASPDGQRFAVNVLASEGAAPIVLVSGWKKELESQ